MNNFKKIKREITADAQVLGSLFPKHLEHFHWLFNRVEEMQEALEMVIQKTRKLHTSSMNLPKHEHVVRLTKSELGDILIAMWKLEGGE